MYGTPNRAEVADVGRMLGGRLSLFGPRGLQLLAALGLRELRPTWGPVRVDQPTAKPWLTAATVARAAQTLDATPTGRLALVAARRVTELGLTREALAQAVLSPTPAGGAQGGRITRYFNGTTTLFSDQGLQILHALGLTGFDVIWGAPSRPSRAKRD
ncbi:hypothetical protein [Deinococcus multiflagellatus]|uniref:Uncharacterized protein n=1 Tax=Deinococcus multiflagellatus TaxID=1656887 RepID=A0ABW1ZQE1_9DEIO